MFPRDILGGPVVKNLSSNVGNCLIPGWGTKIPHTIGDPLVGELSLHVTTREDCTLQPRVHMLQQRHSTVKKKKFSRINKYNTYVLNNCTKYNRFSQLKKISY